MNQYKYRVSLVVRHPSLSLSDVAQKLMQLHGIIPGMLRNFGKQRMTPKNIKLEGTYEESSFAFAFSDEIFSSNVKALQETISEITSFLYPYKELFLELSNTGGSTEFFIGVFLDQNSGITFDKDLIEKLAELKMEIGLDIYPAENKNPVSVND